MDVKLVKCGQNGLAKAQICLPSFFSALSDPAPSQDPSSMTVPTNILRGRVRGVQVGIEVTMSHGQRHLQGNAL